MTRLRITTGRPGGAPTVGVAPAHRGHGVGTAVLAALVEARVRRHRGISLSAEDGNRARLLYEGAGFGVVGRIGGSDTMLLEPHR